MDLSDSFSSIPFAEHLGIEVTRAEDGVAEGWMPMTDELSSNPGHHIAHGGATFALADTVGGAALVSLVTVPTPTIDMRIDYLAPATDDLTAHAEVERRGSTSAVVDIEVEQDDKDVATVRGVYKIGVGENSEHHWERERERGLESQE
jgi:uncharacterized protein (TIGR00369 family)